MEIGAYTATPSKIITIAHTNNTNMRQEYQTPAEREPTSEWNEVKATSVVRVTTTDNTTVAVTKRNVDVG